ncbi:MAG: DUF1345 domain-containing protein [Hyphomicrobiales bacterium]|nr:DUF1345 domain-containing protein [Hyphomicrobiales bacterium]
MSASRPRLSGWYAKPARIARIHLKLVASVALGVLLYVVLPNDLRVTTRMLLAWNVALGLYLVVVAFVIARSDMGGIRRRAAEEDEGAALILVLTVAAAVASLAAIFIELNAARHDKTSGGLYAALAVSTVILSWVFVHVIFAFHYAHAYYGEAKGRHKGGLIFPEDDQPDYFDFIYFAFGIGMTFLVSDVKVSSKALRRVVVCHGAVSFFYNVAVLALMVTIGGEFIA